MREALSRFPRPGRLEWIGLSSAHRAPLHVVAEVEAVAGRGLVGDRHAKTGRASNREVTLVSREALDAVGRWLARDVNPEDVRRNLLVSGVNVTALKGCRFRVGDVLLLGTAPCDPCTRMEEALGEGGLAAMRGMGGLCAKVIEGGTLRVGDPLVFVEIA
jgi:MOSC domain-containing protein YiiM